MKIKIEIPIEWVPIITYALRMAYMLNSEPYKMADKLNKLKRDKEKELNENQN